MLPDLESLRCFEAAAVRLNFRDAAKAVALSPAAFSERIKQLEYQVGHPLFQRTTRRVWLTPRGEALLPQARRTLEEARRCLIATPRLPYALTVGTRFELGLSWLTPALTPLHRAHPERTLHLTFGDSAELLSAVRRGAVDCAVSSVRLAGGDFRYALLHEERYVLVGARTLLDERPLRRAEDARRHILLDVHPDLPLFRYFHDARPASQRWDFAGMEYLGTIGAVRLRLLEGCGVAVLPHYFIREDLAARRLAVLLPRADILHDHFRLIWRAGHQRESELRQLAEELRALPLR